MKISNNLWVVQYFEDGEWWISGADEACCYRARSLARYQARVLVNWGMKVRVRRCRIVVDD